MGGTTPPCILRLHNIRLEISSNFSAVQTQLSFISLITALHNWFGPPREDARQPARLREDTRRGLGPFSFAFRINKRHIFCVYLIFSHTLGYVSLYNIVKWACRRSGSADGEGFFLLLLLLWRKSRTFRSLKSSLVWVVCSRSRWAHTATQQQLSSVWVFSKVVCPSHRMCVYGSILQGSHTEAFTFSFSFFSPLLQAQSMWEGGHHWAAALSHYTPPPPLV